jgi:hypothetical protein
MTKLSDLSDADLEKRIDRMIEELDKRTRFALHHDDGDDGGNGNYQNISNTSMDASNDDGNQQELDEEVQKFSNTYYENTNAGESERPSQLQHSTHPPSSRHKFEALTDKIKNEEGVPKSYAQSLARQRFPDVYRSYQEHNNGGGSAVGKSAPTSYETLLATEIRKGFSPQIAASRLAQQFGFRAFDNSSSFAKSENISDTFRSQAEEIYQSDGCSRTEALRKARLTNTRLFKALQTAT